MFPVAIALAVILGTDDSTLPPAAAANEAIAKAIKRVEAGLTHYPEHRSCFSCHHHALGIISLTAAKSRGFGVNDKVVEDAVAFSLRTFRNRATIAGAGVGGDSTGVVYILHTLASVDHEPDATTARRQYLLVKQRRTVRGHRVRGDRPPTMGASSPTRASPSARSNGSRQRTTRRIVRSCRSGSTRPSRRAASGCWRTSRYPTRIAFSGCAVWWTQVRRGRTSRPRATSY